MDRKSGMIQANISFEFFVGKLIKLSPFHNSPSAASSRSAQFEYHNLAADKRSSGNSLTMW